MGLRPACGVAEPLTAPAGKGRTFQYERQSQAKRVLIEGRDHLLGYHPPGTTHHACHWLGLS